MSSAYERQADDIQRITRHLNDILRTEQSLMADCRSQLDWLIPVLQGQASDDEIKLAIVAQAKRLRSTLDSIEISVDDIRTPPREHLQIVQRTARAIASLQRTSRASAPPDTDPIDRQTGDR